MKGEANLGKRKFIFIYLTITLCGVVMQMLLESSISSSFIILLGGHSLLAASVDSLINLGIVLSAVFSAYLLSKFRYYKQMLVSFSFFSHFSVLCLAASLFFLPPVFVPYVLSVVIFCYFFFTGCSNLPLYEMLHQCVDSRSRVVVMSNSLAISQLSATAVSVGISWALHRPADNQVLNYYDIYLSAVFVVTVCLAATLWLDKVRVVKGEAHENVTFGGMYRNMFRDIRQNRFFAVFLAAVILYAIPWSSTGLFVSLGYRENVERMNEILAYGIFVRTLIKAVCFAVFGLLAKRFGNRFILLLTGVVALCAPLTALFLSIDYFIIVLVATSISPMAYVYFLNELIDRTDAAAFKGRFTLFTLATVPATFIIPLLGLLMEKNPVLFCSVMAFVQLCGVYTVAKWKANRFAYGRSTVSYPTDHQK